MSDDLVASFTTNGDVRVQLQQNSPSPRLFQSAKRRVVPTSEWESAEPTDVVFRVLDLVARGEAEDLTDCVQIPAEKVAALDSGFAAQIGLPPPAPIVLSLKGRGLIIEETFTVECRWVRTNGVPLMVAVRGAHVRMDGQEFRLPEPLFSLHKAANAINGATELSAKQAAFADLQNKLQGHTDQAILDGMLQETRVAFAAHFSLSLGSSGGGVDFDPVLFAPKVGQEAAEGAVVDEEADNLLTPVQQDAFSRLFRKRGGKAPSYLLPDGLLLFIDPEVSNALRVVGEKQRAPSDERRRFAVSPRRALAEALGKEEGAFETAFLETAQYSERVIGIDPWRKPVLPWIKPRPNSWLPERLGIAIGDPPDQRLIEVPLDQATAAVETLEAAIAAGQESANLFGDEVPATQATLDALRSIADLQTEAERTDESAHASIEPPPALREKFFLKVRENFEDVEYAPLFTQFAAGMVPADVPAAVRTLLKPHQVQGFQWLANAWRSNRPGVLLADDMGLGKTLQALTFFSWLRQVEGIRQPILVVAPTGLLANWQEETQRHLSADALGEIILAYGQALAGLRSGSGTDIQAGGPLLRIEDWRSAGMVLTTYETLRDYHMSFAQVGFAVIAFDEAQRIKNPAAQVTRAAKTLRSRFGLALTGTPVENRLQDLWSISDIVHPSLLGTSKSFEQEFGTATLDKLRELNVRLTAPAGSWPPFMLRRMKADHLEGLPAKRLVEKSVPMPPVQAQAYSNAVNRALVMRGSIGREGVLQTLARLRSISLAPGLPELGERFDQSSARLKATFEILSEVRQKGEKALVFCESLELQPLLAAEIRRRFQLPHAVSCVSGEVAGDKRQQLVNQFQSRLPGFDVMILSPRAAGVGLTLTAANHVIHLTRWWNPAVEDQATDRVYRIGQDKDVTVWVPIAEHPTYGDSSFDRKLDALLRRKRDVAQGLLIEPESPEDPEQLLNDVLVAHPAGSVDSTSDGEQVIVQPLPPEPTKDETPRETRRGLTNQRMQKKVGADVPWSMFVEPIQGEAVKRLDIVDPYAAASLASCKAVAQFLAGLRERRVLLQAVDILCFDNWSLPDARFASDADQRAALKSAIAHFNLDDLRIYPRFVSRRERHLHDRSVTARLEDGTTIVWDVGGGLDFLFDGRRACVVSRWINPSDGI